MSKYTTEVRYICEQKAGLTESVGFNDINSVLDKSWDKIFTKNWDIFDEEYRKILCEKILRKYYTREICAETVGLWQLWLDATLCEIMPAYNQLYKTTVLDFNPLYNTDITTTFTKTVKGNDSRTGTSSGTSNNKKTDDYTITNSGKDNTSKTSTRKADNGKTEDFDETNKYNDTPQGGLVDIESNNYLTDVRMISRDNIVSESINETDTDEVEGTNSSTGINKGTSTNTGSNSNTSSEKGTTETTETWTEKVLGKNNGENYGQLLIEFRKSIINIDQMIIKELEPLFMNLW